MLKLSNIIKDYTVGETKLRALKGVSGAFRNNEFVAILGPSGCGKTTLLNIIGGLDHYTEGDLIINGRSTSTYNDHDWDSYRNHSIGFVFQSYNLIGHQTILANVELALTLSGVSKSERKQRAIEVLKNVGLEKEINKKPNQLSGGQMQRVAIARALINNPDILLADEPTGALDSETSIQIMEILKEVAKDKLVIMVTHNPELAASYANRIIKLLDGNIIDDSNPFNPTDEEIAAEAIEYNKLDKKEKKKIDKTRRMSFLTALSLSFNNLLTKKGRTILTAIAGSIGIIGIALILSVSEGVQRYIDTVEKSTMSAYPITVDSQSTDLSGIISVVQQLEKETHAEEGYVETNDLILALSEATANSTRKNNLRDFKDYIENKSTTIKENSTDIVYNYSTSLKPYYYDSEKDKYVKCLSSISSVLKEASGGLVSFPMGSMGMGGTFSRLVGDSNFVKTQYTLKAGKMPEKDNEAILLADKNGRIADYVFYSLGLMDIQDLKNYFSALVLYSVDPNNYPMPKYPDVPKFSYDELIGYSFKYLLSNESYIINSDGLIVENPDYDINKVLKESTNELTIVGIVEPSEEATMDSVLGGVLYQASWVDTLIDHNNNSDVAMLQYLNKEKNLIYNHPFNTPYTDSDYENIKQIINTNKTLKKLFNSTDNDINDVTSVVNFANINMTLSYDDTLDLLGFVDYDSPDSIYIYPKDFDGKDAIINDIKAYNDSVLEPDKISYTDMVGVLVSSVSIIVNAISYVLIAFVSISLVVSSIMIGIITYISVLERTKEIGILRAVGASKRDISNVFNAETFIIGLTSGAIGILVSLLLIIPINAILLHFTKISYLKAQLPILGAFLLILISVLLTFIAGIIPSRYAAKKDPVIALRSE